MGWNGMYTKKDRRLNQQELTEFLLKEFGRENIVDSSIRNSEAYFVCQSPGANNGKRFMLVVLIENKIGEVIYKDMDETMGPYYYNAPERLLNQLDPIDSEQANEWRKKCWNKHGKAYTKPEEITQVQLFA